MSRLTNEFNKMVSKYGDNRVKGNTYIIPWKYVFEFAKFLRERDAKNLDARKHFSFHLKVYYKDEKYERKVTDPRIKLFLSDKDSLLIDGYLKGRHVIPITFTIHTARPHKRNVATVQARTVAAEKFLSHRKYKKVK